MTHTSLPCGPGKRQRNRKAREQCRAEGNGTECKLAATFARDVAHWDGLREGAELRGSEVLFVHVLVVAPKSFRELSKRRGILPGKMAIDIHTRALTSDAEHEDASD